MHVKNVSVKKALTIDCDWLEENLPTSLFEAIQFVIGFFKDEPEA